MDNYVLITYATRMGSTREVARAIAEVLRSHGIEVDLLTADEVQSVSPYSAVILGAALYMGRLHKDARRFLDRFREPLGKVPVSLFVLGPVNDAEKDRQGAQQQLDRELRRFPWFAPVEQRLFGGRWDPATMKFPFNVLLRKAPISDARNWDTIREFAESLAVRLQPPVPV